MNKREKLARALFIDYGFKFYGRDGEPTWCSSTQGKNPDGTFNGRWTSKSGGDCGVLNRKVAAILWDTGKYHIDDFGGEDFDFTCDEKEKDEWRKAADRLIARTEGLE